MAKQTFTTGQVLTAAQMTSLQQTAMLGGAASAKTASYTLVAADAGTAITMSNASATTITVNTALFAAGDTVNITNLGAGVCTITAGTATVNTSATLALAQYESGTLDFISTSSAVFVKGAGAAAPSGATFVGCILTTSAATSCPNETGTAVAFDTETVDTDAFHSNVTNNSRITIPTGKGGNYLFTGTIDFAFNATGYRTLSFYVNAGDEIYNVTRVTAITATNQTTNMTASVVLNLAAAKYVELVGFQNSGGSLNARQFNTRFTATYLGA